MTKDRAGNIDRIRMHFEENECTMAWVEGDEENTVVCGMDGHYRYGQIRLGQIDYKVCCSAAWKDEQTLDVWIRPLQTIAVRKLHFVFKGNRVRMTPRTTPPLKDMAYNIAEGIDDLVKTRCSATCSRKPCTRFGESPSRCIRAGWYKAPLQMQEPCCIFLRQGSAAGGA